MLEEPKSALSGSGVLAPEEEPPDQLSVLLLAAPTSLPDESPFSWVQRVCAAHGYSMRTFRSVLGQMGRSHDWDLLTQGTGWERVRKRAGFAQAPCEEARLGLQRLDGFSALNATNGYRRTGRPKYRWCTVCLSRDPTPYLRWYWRCNLVKDCFLHRVALSDRCEWCGSPMKLERALLVPTPSKPEVFDLAHCGTCGMPLVKHEHAAANAHQKDMATQSDLAYRCMVSVAQRRGFSVYEREDEVEYDEVEWRQVRARDLLTRFDATLPIRLLLAGEEGIPLNGKASANKNLAALLQAAGLRARSTPFDPLHFTPASKYPPNSEGMRLREKDASGLQKRSRWSDSLTPAGRVRLANALGLVRQERNRVRAANNALRVPEDGGEGRAHGTG